MTVRSVILSEAKNPFQLGVRESWVALKRPDAFNHIPLPSEWERLGEGPLPTPTITAMEVALTPPLSRCGRRGSLPDRSTIRALASTRRGSQ